MLIRLFQLTARSSVAECLVHPFLGLFASFSFSSPAKRPARSTWPRAAGPKATSAPDIGDNPSQYEDPSDPLVLGGLPDDDRQARRLGVVSPAPAWSSAL